MRVFLIGAAGGVGLPLAGLLSARGDAVTGMHRKPEQADSIAASGAVPVIGDLIADSVPDLAAAFAGHDAVVFSAGAHGTGSDQTTLIDGEGVTKAVAAAASAGVARFVLVSVFPDAGRGGEVSEGFEHYMRVKKAADVELASSALDWVIVRPGTLRDDAGTGLVTVGPAIAYGDVNRADVAAVIDAVLHEPAVTRCILEVTSGATPVAEAVAALAR